MAVDPRTIDVDPGEARGQLAANIVHFARALRAAGLPVGPGAVLDALAAVQAAGVGAKARFRTRPNDWMDLEVLESQAPAGFATR